MPMTHDSLLGPSHLYDQQKGRQLAVPLTDIKGLFSEEAAFSLALTLFGNYSRVTRERLTAKTRESVESGT